MTVSIKSTTKGTVVKKITATQPAKKDTPILTKRVRDGVEAVWEWYSELPPTFERLEKAIHLLDVLISSDASTFAEEILTAWESNNPRIQLIEGLLRAGKITGRTSFRELADIVGNL
jgi:hypothetical protein